MSGSPNYGPTDISALPQIKSLETVKYLTEAYRQGSLTAGQYCQLLTTNIEKGRLPYEVVTSLAAPTKEVWEYLMREMPLFALLRHLNTLQRHGVLESRKNIQYVVDRLTDAPAVKKAMLWPSRIATAYNNFDGPQQIRDALRDMADLALSSIPTINGTTAVFLDISGSMVPEYKQHGAVLGVGALKASTDAEFWCFGSQLWYPNVSTRDSILSNLDKVVGMRGGGTHTIGCIEHLLGTCKVQSTTGYHTGGYNNSVPSGMQSRQPVKVDNIIILTDEQQNSGAPVVTAFREYRKRVNKDARMFIVDVAPYSGSIASSNEPGVHFIFGWSDEILRYISFVVNGTHGQTDTVARMSLD
jgi:60 kDa SS-A/Ro ribonucleoprotein